MSDAKGHGEEKHGAEGAAPAEGAKKKGAMGPVLALGGVFALAAVLIIMLLKVLNPTAPAKADAHGGDGHGGAAAAHGDGHGDGNAASVMGKATALNLGAILANVKGENGRRYVKLNCTLWVDKAEVAHGMDKPEVREVMKQAVEERLAAFTLQELTSDFSRTTLKRQFEDGVNKELRRLFGVAGTDKVYVHEVTLTELAIQ